MEFRPSTTLYGVRLFDGTSESRKSFTIGHCKNRQEVAGKQYGVNWIIPFTPFQKLFDATFHIANNPIKAFIKHLRVIQRVNAAKSAISLLSA